MIPTMLMCRHITGSSIELVTFYAWMSHRSVLSGSTNKQPLKLVRYKDPTANNWESPKEKVLNTFRKPGEVLSRTTFFKLQGRNFGSLEAKWGRRKTSAQHFKNSRYFIFSEPAADTIPIKMCNFCWVKGTFYNYPLQNASNKINLQGAAFYQMCLQMCCFFPPSILLTFLFTFSSISLRGFGISHAATLNNVYDDSPVKVTVNRCTILWYSLALHESTAQP